MSQQASQRPQRPFLDVDRVLRVLGPQGPFCTSLSGFEVREQQVVMMRDILEAYNRDTVTLVEAGTGTGKSLAYLIPALAWAKMHSEKTLVSTNTINLQEQLLLKDIPLIKKTLNLDIKAVLVKGMSNYLCLRKLNDALGEVATLLPGDAQELHRIDGWSKSTRDGSRSDLPFMPSEGTWEKVCAEGDACPGKHCAHHEKCVFLRARRNAADADVLIANHHLLFADLSLRAETGNFDAPSVLPAYHRVILDEAHNIEDTATSHFADRLSTLAITRQLSRLLLEKPNQPNQGRVPALIAQIEREYSGNPQQKVQALLNRLQNEIPAEKYALQSMVNEAFQGFGSFMDFVAQPKESTSVDGKLRIRQGHRDHALWRAETIPRVEKLVTAMKSFLTGLGSLSKEIEYLNNEALKESTAGILVDIEAIAGRLGESSGILESFAKDEESSELICWIERVNRKGFVNIFLNMANLNIAEPLVESLFKPFSSVILASATLTTNRNFQFVRNRLGLVEQMLPDRQVCEALYESPFDFQRQALLAIPTDMPLPSDPAFTQAAMERIWQAIRASHGNTFVLFTSYTMLNTCYRTLEPKLTQWKHAVYKQGDDSRQVLLEKFKQTDKSVLFGTDSFWEGVDVSGDALRSVIIVKLPFKVPTEPLVQARCETITAAGGNAFLEYTVPNAIVKFKQGFGRLIRHKKDRGCILCLDSRLTAKNYGKLFLNSLPGCQQVVADTATVMCAMAEFYKKTYYLTKK